VVFHEQQVLPDATHVEVDWVRDPSLAVFHAPVPVVEDALTASVHH
jgi:hypothetical protein